jgi:hypothetical protein
MIYWLRKNYNRLSFPNNLIFLENFLLFWWLLDRLLLRLIIYSLDDFLRVNIHCLDYFVLFDCRWLFLSNYFGCDYDIFLFFCYLSNLFLD